VKRRAQNETDTRTLKLEAEGKGSLAAGTRVGDVKRGKGLIRKVVRKFLREKRKNIPGPRCVKRKGGGSVFRTFIVAQRGRTLP